MTSSKLMNQVQEAAEGLEPADLSNFVKLMHNMSVSTRKEKGHHLYFLLYKKHNERNAEKLRSAIAASLDVPFIPSPNAEQRLDSPPSAPIVATVPSAPTEPEPPASVPSTPSAPALSRSLRASPSARILATAPSVSIVDIPPSSSGANLDTCSTPAFVLVWTLLGFNVIFLFFALFRLAKYCFPQYTPTFIILA